MKSNVLKLLVFIFVLVSTHALAAADSPQLPRPMGEWTVMVYVVASDLESPKPKDYASQDISEMSQGTQGNNSDTIHVVVTTGGSKAPNWDTVKRFFIHDGQPPHVLADLGKQKMSEPQTLSKFVQYAQANFPAQHYALILWNHGGGTAGFGQDRSVVPAEMMDLTGLKNSYQSIQKQNGLLDIVVYDACLMSSIEVAEITSGVTKVMAASTESEPEHGLDYAHLLKTIATNPPKNGVEFGKIVKTGYLQQARTKGTFNSSQITYSVLDLTQLPAFNKTLESFAKELNKQLQKKGILTSEMLSRGIIRAPGYPSKNAKRLPSLDLDDYPEPEGMGNFRIDLYNFLQHIPLEFPQLQSHATTLQTQLKQLVVDYAVNDRVKAIDPEAGRISLDISTGYLEKYYLRVSPPVLPPAYSELNNALEYYNQKRKKSTSSLDGKLVCPSGVTCADAKWFELSGDKVISVDGYYGQQSEQGADVFLIKPLYRYQSLDEDKEIGVNGREACRHQLCVSETECSDLTVTENNGLWLADVEYNGSPAVLTLCRVDNSWQACSVLSQHKNIWGRDEPVSEGDRITPKVLSVSGKDIHVKPSSTVTVGKTTPVIKSECDAQTAVIIANYFGNNYKPQLERLCDQGDCVCKENDVDESCRQTNFQFKAGIRIEK